MKVVALCPELTPTIVARNASIGTPSYIVWGRDPVLVISFNSRSRYITSNPPHD